MSDRRDVLLAVLPFGSVTEPTIGVSILKASVDNAGFCSRVRYFNLGFAARIGLNLYDQIGGLFASRSLLGDWVFSKALFGDRAPEEKEYLAHIKADYERWEDGTSYGVEFGGKKTFTQYAVDVLLPRIVAARRIAEGFVEECVDEIQALGPRVVGFTSSCQQACSCLAVARRLKERAKTPIIIFGGPNCQGEMGLQWLKLFPWIDYVCTGEGDEVFPAFLEKILRNGDARSIDGILRQNESVGLTAPALVEILDKVGTPDYSDYLEQLEQSPIRRRIGGLRLPIETSRGCWWGEKKQCMFCGNSGMMIRYRSKSPERVFGEIKHFGEKAFCSHLYCVDDALDPKHVRTVFTRLGKNVRMPPIFYQTRPTIKFDELRILLEGGVTLIQPGIESFSDKILRLMRKGCTGLQNIRLLRWCGELGMGVSWRILYGFPGEPIYEYGRMAALVPLLTHLAPPMGCSWIALKRFSPYWSSPDNFGLRGVRPWPSYSLIYPFGQEELEKLAYFFDFDYADGRQPFEYSRSLRTEVGNWIMLRQAGARERPRLDLLWEGNDAVITDTRPCATRREHKLAGLSARIYRFCNTIRTYGCIVTEYGDECGEVRVRSELASLVSEKIMVEDNGKYLSLAIRRKATEPPE